MPAISGLRETDADADNWASYFGSLIQVEPDFHNTGRSLLAGSKVRIVLTPTGPLLDGSMGGPLVRDIPVNSTFVHFKWMDIPKIGRIPGFSHAAAAEWQSDPAAR